MPNAANGVTSKRMSVTPLAGTGGHAFQAAYPMVSPMVLTPPKKRRSKLQKVSGEPMPTANPLIQWRLTDCIGDFQILTLVQVDGCGDFAVESSDLVYDLDGNRLCMGNRSWHAVESGAASTDVIDKVETVWEHGESVIELIDTIDVWGNQASKGEW